MNLAKVRRNIDKVMQARLRRNMQYEEESYYHVYNRGAHAQSIFLERENTNISFHCLRRTQKGTIQSWQPIASCQIIII